MVASLSEYFSHINISRFLVALWANRNLPKTSRKQKIFFCVSRSIATCFHRRGRKSLDLRLLTHSCLLSECVSGLSLPRRPVKNVSIRCGEAVRNHYTASHTHIFSHVFASEEMPSLASRNPHPHAPNAGGGYDKSLIFVKNQSKFKE